MIFIRFLLWQVKCAATKYLSLSLCKLYSDIKQAYPIPVAVAIVIIACGVFLLTFDSYLSFLSHVSIQIQLKKFILENLPCFSGMERSSMWFEHHLHSLGWEWCHSEAQSRGTARHRPWPFLGCQYPQSIWKKWTSIWNGFSSSNNSLIFLNLVKSKTEYILSPKENLPSSLSQHFYKKEACDGEEWG